MTTPTARSNLPAWLVWTLWMGLLTAAAALALGSAASAYPVRPVVDEVVLGHVLERQMTLFDEEADNLWAQRRLQRHALDLLATEGGADRGMQALTGATVSRADLPDPSVATLEVLHNRLTEAEARGSDHVTLLSGSARIELTRRLKSELAMRTPETFRFQAWGALAWSALAWWMLGLASLAGTSGRGPGLRLMAAVSFLAAFSLVLMTCQLMGLVGPNMAYAVARHNVLAALLGVALVVAGRSLPRLSGGLHGTRGWIAVLGAAGLLAVLLATFGSGPAGSNARINLALPGVGSWQPLELVKLLAVVAFAGWAGNLATRRLQRAGLRWRSLSRALPAAAASAAMVAFIGLALSDYGASMILSLAFTLLAVVVLGRLDVAAGITTGGVAGWAALSLVPWDVGDKVGRRVLMWLEPFTNGLLGGDQVPHALWAISAGGLLGQGLSGASAEFIPAGSTDLVLALLTEATGLLGLCLVMLAYAVAAFSAVQIGAQASHLPNARRLLPVAFAALLVSQVAVAAGGTLGLLPLTGVVCPFLSLGGSALVVFTVASAGTVTLARSLPGRATATQRQDPLLPGMAVGSLLIGLGGLLVIATGVWVAVLAAPTITARAAVVRLADGRRSAVQNPRLIQLYNSLPRQRILDPDGEPLAWTDHGQRVYGQWAEATAPLMGMAFNGVQPFPGTLEATRLAEYSPFPVRDVGTGVLSICDQPPCSREQWRDVGLYALGDPELDRLVESMVVAPMEIRKTEVRAPDLSALVPAARSTGARRARRLQGVADGIGDFWTPIRGPLQGAIYRIAAEAARERGATMVAVAVVDPATGQVLALVSAPSAEPTRGLAFQADDPAIGGAWGVLADRAGDLALPPGSTIKAVIEACAAEHGIDIITHCDGHHTFGSGGSRGVLHCHGGHAHGDLDREGRLYKSCNIGEAQVAEALGPERLAACLERLPTTNLHVPSTPGISLARTAIGQHKTEVTALQLARIYAALAGDGVDRECALLAPEGQPLACTETRLFSEEAAAAVWPGLRSVVVRGTGRRAREPDGASYMVSGKTGTSEQDPTQGEPDNGHLQADHAWFAGWVEDRGSARRLAFAVLVARGGGGGAAAAPIAGATAEALDELGLLGSP